MKTKPLPELKPRTYKIKYDKKTGSYKIYADRETQKLIAEILGGKDCFIEVHKSLRLQDLSPSRRDFAYLEIDNRALKILQERQENFQLKTDDKLPEQNIINENVKKEEEFSKILHQANYHAGKRIWQENGKYYSKIHGDIYSSNKLEDLIALIKGDVLVERKKDITSLGINLSENQFKNILAAPFRIFGVYDFVAKDILGANKSLLSYNFSQNQRKKDYEQLLKDVDQFRVIIDGADDLGHAFGESRIASEQVATHLQGLLLFPLFIRGVTEGFKSFQDETHDVTVAFAQKPIFLADLKAKLEKFRQEICKLVDLDYNQTLQDSPQQLTVKIAAKMRHLKEDSAISQQEKNEKLNKVVKLISSYHALAQEKIEAPKEHAILAAYSGWFSMMAMMGALSVYEIQALINIADGVEGATFTEDPENLALMSQIGMGLGIGGQFLMTAYALYKYREQGLKLEEVREKIHQFKDCQDVSQLAKKISEEILGGQEQFHKQQKYGHLALVLGQSLLMASNVGGLAGAASVAIEPVALAGLAITLGSVGVNAYSEFKFKNSFEIKHKNDPVENKILTFLPQFNLNDVAKLNQALLDHSRHQAFALEVLGHLRAPQFVLYEEYIAANKNSNSVFSKLFAVMGDKIMNRFRQPVKDSIDMVRDNSQIKEIVQNSENLSLDIFEVKEEDIDFIWQISAVLAQLNQLRKAQSDDATISAIVVQVNKIRHDKFDDISNLEYQNGDIDALHKNIIAAIQNDFVDARKKQFENAAQISVKATCKKIIEQDGDGALYLKRKLLRAVENGELKDGPTINKEAQIYKNGKKIAVAKCDAEFIDKFDENNLKEFLTKRRLKKNFSGYVLREEKRSALTKAHKENLDEVRSDHMRPFSKIVDLSVGTKQFLEEIQQEEQNEMADENKLPQNPQIIKPAMKFEQQRDLLNALDSHIKEHPPENLRQENVKKQNEIVDKLTQQEKFILRSEIVDEENIRSFFIYDDPEHVGDEKYQIIYERDDFDGEMKIYYGKEAHALILQKADFEKDAYAAEIDKCKFHPYCDSTSLNIGLINDVLRHDIAKANRAPSSVVKVSKQQQLQEAVVAETVMK